MKKGRENFPWSCFPPKLVFHLSTFLNCQTLKKYFHTHGLPFLISIFFNTSQSSFWSHNSTKTFLTVRNTNLSKPLVLAAFVSVQLLPGPNVLKRSPPLAYMTLLPWSPPKPFHLLPSPKTPITTLVPHWGEEIRII